MKRQAGRSSSSCAAAMKRLRMFTSGFIAYMRDHYKNFPHPTYWNTGPL